jgi:hypothetical protein
MTKINVITPPDILHNQNKSFLLIFPNTDVRNEFQAFLEKFAKAINVYLYSPEEDGDKDVAWLLAMAKIVDYTIFDVDNTEQEEKKFASYIMSLPNTFYLTKDEVTPYNKLSLNRIYDLKWLFELEL